MQEWLTDDIRRLLCRPSDWRWIADGPPVDDDRHRRWCQRHREAHSHLEVLLAYRGETLYGLGEALYPVDTGSIIVFPGMAPHQLNYPPWVTAIEHIWFSLVAGRVTCRLYSLEGGRMRQLPVILAVLPPDLPERLHAAAAATGPSASLRLHSAVTELVATVVESETSATRPDDHIASVMQSIMQHLQTTAGRGASIAGLATVAAYSPYHFQRLFKRTAGCTVQAYIDRCRIARTRTMMAAGSSQKAIAQELGFSSPQAFSRWLRQHPVGESPASGESFEVP